VRGDAGFLGNRLGGRDLLGGRVCRRVLQNEEMYLEGRRIRFVPWPNCSISLNLIERTYTRIE